MRKGFRFIFLIILLMTLSCDNTTVKPDVISDPTKDLRVKYVCDLKGHGQYVFFMDFSPDSKFLVSGSADKTVRLWDYKQTNEISDIIESYDEVWGIPVRYSKNGKYIAIGSHETLKIIEVNDKLEIKNARFAHKKGIQTLDISPNSRFIATAGVDGKIIVWSYPKLEKITEIIAHDAEIWNIKISPNGKFLISGSQDNLAKQWSFPELKFIQELKYHDMPIEYVDISSDGEMLLLGSGDSKISVWKTKNLSSPYRVLKGHVGSVLVAKFTADSRYILSGGDDDEIYMFDIESGEVKERLQKHFGDVMTIAISRDGKYMASGSRDRRIKIWVLHYR